MSEATELEYGRRSSLSKQNDFDVQCTELFVIILITIIIIWTVLM